MAMDLPTLPSPYPRPPNPRARTDTRNVPNSPASDYHSAPLPQCLISQVSLLICKDHPLSTDPLPPSIPSPPAPHPPWPPPSQHGPRSSDLCTVYASAVACEYHVYLYKITAHAPSCATVSLAFPLSFRFTGTPNPAKYGHTTDVVF